MSKLLVERNVFQKLIDLFFKAKANDNQDQFISKIKYTNPELGNAFKKMDDSMVKSTLALRDALESAGLDTTEADDFLKKYYNKF